MFPTAPNLASGNEETLGLGLSGDQLAPFARTRGVIFAESTVAVALENMFMSRLVPATNCNAPSGGVKVAVYTALPFTIRTFPMNPV
jgi:hypothetical protein